MTTGSFWGIMAGGFALGALIKFVASKDSSPNTLEKFVGTIQKTDCNNTLRSVEGRTLCQSVQLGIEVPFQNDSNKERRLK